MFGNPEKGNVVFVGNAFNTKKGIVIKVDTNILEADLINDIPFGKEQVETPVLTLYIQPNDPADISKGIWCSQLETTAPQPQDDEEENPKKKFGK
jgi:hypothetical protein